MISVAIIGPDGAGKSTITELLEREPMPAPVKRIYMGVNLEASSLMLPTTRLALAVKSARGRRSDMVAPSAPGSQPSASGSGRPLRRAVKGGLRGTRMLLWLAEEWFRQAVAEYHRRRGSIVVFDRHFYADYYHFDVAAGDRRSVSSRVHGYLLEHAYPKPDLVICLDAPGSVLFERKGEASPEWLEQRRRQYLQLAAVVPAFVVVDVDRPLDLVTREVATVITEFFEKRRA
jgi:thymidylate kinase